MTDREIRRVLDIADLEVVYGGSIKVLHGLSLRVEQRSIVALLGANGVGKSTTLKAISGVLKNDKGNIAGGSIHFGDTDLDRQTPDRIVELGIVQVPEGRRLFADLTVEQNLQIGACRRPRREVRSWLEASTDVFRASSPGAKLPPVIFPAASSRWSQSAARSWPDQRSCCWTSHRSGLLHRSSSNCSKA